MPTYDIPRDSVDVLCCIYGKLLHRSRVRPQHGIMVRCVQLGQSHRISVPSIRGGAFGIAGTTSGRLEAEVPACCGSLIGRLCMRFVSPS
ncbi:hypothetical protein KY285_010558 [Solanum tuberosum]|nr:hypothetical protein KY289_011104 [Solanum tuberosum]KAH0734851.1 hypothetical protein KY285_010558 [Solanum tuberosum]